MKLKELEKKYKISTVTIRKWIKENKIPLPSSWRRGLPFDIDEQDFLKVKNIIGMIELKFPIK